MRTLAAVLSASLAAAITGPILAILCTACGSGDAPAPGYGGPCPSPAGQTAMSAILGREISGIGLGPSGSTLIVESFGVVPNAVTGKGPVVMLVLPESRGKPVAMHAPQGAGGRWVLPVLTDGDVADLVERVTGSRPAELDGETSAIYRHTIGAR